MFLASACFVTMSALVKAVGHELPLVELIFLRTLPVLPILLWANISRGCSLVVRNRKILLLRTLFGGLAMFGFYYALTAMPLAECVFIGRTQPILLALLAPLVTGDRTGVRVWLAIALGLAGTLMIMHPGSPLQVAALFALAGALFSALAHLMVRLLSRTDPTPVIVFNFTFLLCTGSGLLAFFHGMVMPGPIQWFMVIAIGLLASSGQFLLTRAYALERAPRVAAASYASVFLSVLYGYLFWQESPDGAALAGGGLIVASGLVLMWPTKGLRQWKTSSFS